MPLKKTQQNRRRKPTQERSVMTTESILEATAQILPKLGFEAASTNRIAEAAGVSIGSLYQYFSNRDAIINSLIEREVERHFQVTSTKLMDLKNAPPPELVEGILEVVLTLFEDRRDLRAMLFQRIGRFSAVTRMEQVENRFTALLAEVLATRKSETRIQDEKLSAFVLTHSVMGVVRANLTPGRRFEKAKLKAELGRLLLGYL
jgi:AcrR family transcriptional regulator